MTSSVPIAVVCLSRARVRLAPPRRHPDAHEPVRPAGGHDRRGRVPVHRGHDAPGVRVHARRYRRIHEVPHRDESILARRDDVRVVYLHVQTNNDAALDFYARHGFEKVGKIEGYYKRIEPPDCYLLGKVVNAPAGATVGGLLEGALDIANKRP